MSDADLKTEESFLQSFLRHRACVTENLFKVEVELRCRAEAHDLSKLHEPELSTFKRIHKIPGMYAYGSDKYKAALESESEGIQTHYTHNSHHPEYHMAHGALGEMGFIDIIEMVCDWRGAWEAYGRIRPWGENVQLCLNRWDFSEEQCWLIKQVADYLDKD